MILPNTHVWSIISLGLCWPECLAKLFVYTPHFPVFHVLVLSPGLGIVIVGGLAIIRDLHPVKPVLLDTGDLGEEDNHADYCG